MPACIPGCRRLVCPETLNYLQKMSNLKVRPTEASRSMMKVFSVIMAMMVTGMMFAALANGLLEEGGPFGIVWIFSCVAIVGFVLFAAFRRKWSAGVVVEIEQDDDGTDGGDHRKIDSRLRTLEELKRKGLVSEEEYRTQREHIIRSI